MERCRARGGDDGVVVGCPEAVFDALYRAQPLRRRIWNCGSGVGLDVLDLLQRTSAVLRRRIYGSLLAPLRKPPPSTEGHRLWFLRRYAGLIRIRRRLVPSLISLRRFAGGISAQ